MFICNWVDTWWQQDITHLHTNNTHNTEKGKFGKCGPCLVFASYTLAFALQLRKKHGKTSASKFVLYVPSKGVLQVIFLGQKSLCCVVRTLLVAEACVCEVFIIWLYIGYAAG
jgi:hypothetical protein